MESLFIHVIVGLVGMEKETAVVVFLTLNTTALRVWILSIVCPSCRVFPRPSATW